MLLLLVLRELNETELRWTRSLNPSIENKNTFVSAVLLKAIIDLVVHSLCLSILPTFCVHFCANKVWYFVGRFVSRTTSNKIENEINKSLPVKNL